MSSKRYPITITPINFYGKRKPLLVLAQGLQLDVLIVVATLCNELIVRAGFADTALFDEITMTSRSVHEANAMFRIHSHAVRVLDSRQPVGNGNGRPSARSLVKRSLDYLLGVGVERRGGLIEEQNLGVAEKSTGDGNTFYVTFQISISRERTAH